MSKQITATLNTGNFSILVSGTPKASKLNEKDARTVEEQMLLDGLIYDLQRTPATKAYLSLAGVPGKKAGSLVFPKGFERDSIPFTKDNAETMRASVEKHFGVRLDGCKVVVLEHVKDEEQDGRKRARAIYAKWVAEDKLDAKVALIDYEGDTSDEEAVVDAIHAYINSPNS